MTHSLWKTINATLAALTLLGGLTACGGGGGNPDATVAPASTDAPTSVQPTSLGTVPRFAYVANSTSNTVSIYRVDASTGQWHPHGYAVTGDRPSGVTVDPSGQFAYVTNYYGNSLSAYAINASNGALTKVGDDVPTGQTPSAITIDAQHHFAYVSIGQVGAIAIYAIDAGSGALTKVGDDVPTGEGPSKLVIDPSGQFAYVATRGAQTLLAFAIDAQSGTLTQIGAANALEAPDAIAVDPAGKFVYALTDGSVITTFGIDAHTGALTHEGDYVVGGSETVAFTLMPSGKFGYVVDKTNNIVTAFSVDSATGALTKIGDVATGKQPVAVTVDAMGHFAYVANGGDHTVTAYSIDASTGQLTNVGLVRAQFEPSSIAMVNGLSAVSVTPQFVYVANMGANTVSAFSVDASSGALKNRNDSAAGTSPIIVATDPYGRFAYVTNDNSSTITVYSIDSVGALHKLSDIGPDDAALQAAFDLKVDPSGRFVYVSYRDANQIQAYAIDPSTGNLKSAGLYGTRSGTFTLTIDPLGQFIYASSGFSNAMSIWRIDVNTGSLGVVGDFISTAGSFGIPSIDPSGQYLYVASDGLNVVIHVYAIEANSGHLVDTQPSVSPQSVLSTPVDKPTLTVASLAIDPLGRFAYAAVQGSDGNNVVSAYTISATGALTKVSEVPYGSADDWPGQVTIDPSGRFAYMIDFTGGTGTVSAYSIHANTGALTKVGDFAVGSIPASVVVTGTTQ